MFSKPIMIAASVAAANATLMAKPSGTNALATKSDATGCALCISRSDTNIVFVLGDAATDKANYWSTVTTWKTTSISAVAGKTDSVLGDACCESASTNESAAATSVICAKGFVAFDGTHAHSQLKLIANDFYQSALAQCPHNTANCTYAGKKADTTTDVAATDQRFIKVEEQGSVITLKMIGLKSDAVGTAPSLTQKLGDVCTWIVETKCDAPVLTIKASSTELSATPEWSIQVLEWDEEFLNTTDNWADTEYTGSSTCKFYPKLATEMVTSGKIADLKADTVEKTTPDNLMGDISFKLPDKDGVVYMKVPGNTLVAWMANIKAVYDSYSKEATAYDAERVIWDKYAKYEAPAPGLFDWLFGATEDPDKPAAASSPLAPTQPVAVPTTVSSLLISGDATKTPNPAKYDNKKGYGYPSAYTLVPIKGKTVKAFGTLAGGGVAKDIAVDAQTASSKLSVRKTANYDSAGKAIASCKKSYLMITAVWNVATAAKTVEMIITTSAWANTLE